MVDTPDSSGQCVHMDTVSKCTRCNCVQVDTLGKGARMAKNDKSPNRRNAPGAPDATAAETDLANAAAGMTEDDYPIEDGSKPAAGAPDSGDADGATDPADETTDTAATVDPDATPDPDADDAPDTAGDGTPDPNAPIAEASSEDKPEPPKQRQAPRTANALRPGCPGIPSFDHVKGKPNMRGEEVHAKGKTPGGIDVVVTTGGRKIFLCSIVKYEKEFGRLNPRQLWIDHFPNAAPRGKK